ncbi:hypothetical protein DITRI_Ditri14bG0033200 [Diplodiscus trichospermus]
MALDLEADDGMILLTFRYVGYHQFRKFIYLDHGIFCDGNKEMTETQNELYRRTLPQDINRHAAVVLEGRAVDIELEDTRAVAEALARSKQANALGGTEQIKCSLSTHEAYCSLRASISVIKAMGLKDPLVKPEVARQVFDALTITISTKDELLHCFQHWTSILELLRHFWASYPITTTYLYTKVNAALVLTWLCYQKLGAGRSSPPSLCPAYNDTGSWAHPKKSSVRKKHFYSNQKQGKLTEGCHVKYLPTARGDLRDLSHQTFGIRFNFSPSSSNATDSLHFASLSSTRLILLQPETSTRPVYHRRTT